MLVVKNIIQQFFKFHQFLFSTKKQIPLLTNHQAVL